MSEPISIPIEDQIKAAKERLAKIEASRAKREALENSPEAQLAKLNAEAKDQEAIEQAICEHGPIGKEIGVIRTDAGVVIVKRCAYATMRKFQAKGEDATMDDAEKLVAPCVVYPDKETFNSYVERWPVLTNNCAGLIAKLAGLKQKEFEGK